MIHHIVNNLWLGSQRDADELIRKNPQNITAILNVRGPDAYKPPGRDQSAEHAGKAYKWIPAPDTSVIIPGHVKEALAWLQEQTEREERILIHCMHGISRSAGFLAAFMVKSGISRSVEEAVAAISVHRAVQPATEIVEYVKPVVLVSALTGLPNRHWRWACRSRPARSATSRASAAAALWIATSRLATNLSFDPLPNSPRSKQAREKAARTGRARSSAAGSPLA